VITGREIYQLDECFVELTQYIENNLKTIFEFIEVDKYLKLHPQDKHAAFIINPAAKYELEKVRWINPRQVYELKFMFHFDLSVAIYFHRNQFNELMELFDMSQDYTVAELFETFKNYNIIAFYSHKANPINHFTYRFRNEFQTVEV
jgi:hypothetical protein